MLTLIEGGRVYDPDPCGVQSVLLADGHVGKVGDINRRALESLGADYEVIDASGCIVVPGLIDPHIHLLGPASARRRRSSSSARSSASASPPWWARSAWTPR